jgi:hypothetical protein
MASKKPFYKIWSIIRAHAPEQVSLHDALTRWLRDVFKLRFTQVSDTGHDCNHDQLRIDEEMQARHRSAQIICVRCEKRWGLA